MKKSECFEMRLYEAIGVRYFRKLVFMLERAIHRKDNGMNENYHLPCRDIAGIDSFVKYLFYNGMIHVRNSLVITLYLLVKGLYLKHLNWYDFLIGIFFMKDIFCVILQRYNYLRIKERKERLEVKRKSIVEREVSKINFYAICDYSYEMMAEDMRLVRKLRESISCGQGVFLGKEDEAALKRLAKLMDSRY